MPGSSKKTGFVAIVAFIAGAVGWFVVTRDDIPQRVADHETRLTEISTVSARHQTEIREHRGAIDDHEKRLRALAVEMGEVKTALDTARARLDAVEADASSAKSERDRLAKSIEALEKDLASLEADHRLRVAEIRKLETQRAEADARDADIERRLRALEKGAGVDRIP